MNDSGKRKSANQSSGSMEKKRTGPKQWRVTRPGGASHAASGSIEPGGAGIWATCAKGREGKCTGELQDLFAEYAEELYPAEEDSEVTKEGEGNDDDDEDIEAEIKREVEAIRKPKKEVLFRPIKIDVQCVIFFKTREPIEPVSFVHRICANAVESTERRRGRWVQRLTPMTLMGKATEKGLDEVARVVLARHFHAHNVSPRKFAIRPTIRNHHSLTRDGVIKQLADIVGPAHKVDLTNYDLLILVEIYRNVCGMSVVGNDFEKLKRYNLAEINHPTPKAVTAPKDSPKPETDAGAADDDEEGGNGDEQLTTNEPISVPASQPQ